MSKWTSNIREVFDKVMDFVSELHPFSAGTYSATQVKAGLFEFAQETNWLIEGYDQHRHFERSQFLATANIHDGMGQDELFDIIEKLEFHMKSKFPYDAHTRGNLSDRAFTKAEFISDKISKMSPAKIEDFSHKFDRMVGVYTSPKLIIDNEL